MSQSRDSRMPRGGDSLEPRVACKANVNQLNGTMQIISEKNSDNQDNISQLNETIQIMQSDIDDYSASCDAKIKEITDTLEYVKKIPMVIIVPSSEEIDYHRGEVIKIKLNTDCNGYSVTSRKTKKNATTT